MTEATKPVINFTFTLDEVNGILAGLAKSPAEFAMFGIQIIQQQAQPQVDALKLAEAKALAEKGEKKDEQ